MLRLYFVEIDDRKIRKSLINSGCLSQLIIMLPVFLLWDLLLSLACLQRFHQIILISLHIAHLHWSFIFVAAEKVPFKPHDFKLILKVLLRVRIMLNLARFIFLDDPLAHLPDHLNIDLADCDSFLTVADQLVDEGVLGGGGVALFVRTACSVGRVHFLGPERFERTDLPTGLLLGNGLKTLPIEFRPEDTGLIQVFLVLERSFDVIHLDVHVIILGLGASLDSELIILPLVFFKLAIHLFLRVLINFIHHRVDFVRFLNSPLQLVMEIFGHEAKESQHHHGKN